MRILLDNYVDHRFGRLLIGHESIHARKMGWAELENGDLIAAAEKAGFAVLVTGDKQMRYQQNLTDRKLSIIILNALFVDMPGFKPLVPRVLVAIENLSERSFINDQSLRDLEI
jgi:predicted nuclease of predicted toxin-antitoxin system